MRARHRHIAVILVGLLASALAGTGAASAQERLTLYKHTRMYTATYHSDPPQGQCCVQNTNVYAVCSQQIFPAIGPNNCYDEYVTSTDIQPADPPSVSVSSSP